MKKGYKLAKLERQHDELIEKSKALLQKIDEITTEEFSRGDDKEQREALRKLLAEIEQGFII